MNQPRGLLLQAPGINCDIETGHAFEQAGGVAVPIHIEELLEGSAHITDFDAFLASGGFSYGDTIRSGAILGRIIRERFADDLNTLVERGSPIIGVCNGFQVLVEAGLLPGGKIEDAPKQVSLIRNESGRFECDWSTVKVGESACRFIEREHVGTTQTLPHANAEGRFVAPELEIPAEQVVLQFVDANGEPTTSYPANPNGSPDGITAICDPSGVVLGMMPHPERALYVHQHKAWRRPENRGRVPFGAVLFKGIVDHAKSL